VHFSLSAAAKCATADENKLSWLEASIVILFLLEATFTGLSD
jgi:hypothetical protein